MRLYASIRIGQTRGLAAAEGQRSDKLDAVRHHRADRHQLHLLFLWIFGNNIEDALGKVRFLAWYLVAGNVQDASIPSIGASGAIAGVLGAYFVLLPRARVLTVIFFIIREIPAMWFLAVWIGLQLWSGGLTLLAPQSGGGTAFFAHIGGFLFGIATILLVAKRRPVVPTSRYPVY